MKYILSRCVYKLRFEYLLSLKFCYGLKTSLRSYKNVLYIEIIFSTMILISKIEKIAHCTQYLTKLLNLY